MSATLIKGNISSIPAELLVNKVRSSYNWDEMDIGDCKVFDNPDDFQKIRSSFTNYATKSKKNSNLQFKGRVIATGGPNGDKKVLEVYRLPDRASTVAQPESQQVTAEVQQPENTVSELPEIDPPEFKKNKK